MGSLQNLWDPQISIGKAIVFEDLAEQNIKEAGHPILGRIIGPHFVPDGTSRNKRFYPKKLWDRVMSDRETRNLIERKLMFGTIGHARDWDAEKFVREGLVSHITSRIWVDPESGLGMAEDLIVDSPAGRMLYTLAKAGSQFYTSSRAAGSFVDEDSSDVPTVDPKSFRLYGFDYVVDPGFLEASPSLVESFQKNGIEIVGTIIEDNNENGGTVIMADEKKIIESLTEEKLGLEKALSNTLSELNVYKAIGEAKDITEAMARLKAYMKIGTLKTIQEKLDAAAKLVADYESLGTPADVNEAFDVAEKVISEYKTHGRPADIVKLKETLKGLQSQLEAYKSLGSPEEVNEALDRAFDLANYIRKLEEDTAIKDLSKTYRMSESAVSDMISSIKNISKVEEILKKITEGKKYKVKEDDAPNPDDNVTSEQEDDDKSNPDDDKDKDNLIPATEQDDDKPNPEDELPTPMTDEDDDDIQTNPLLMQPKDDKEEDGDEAPDDKTEPQEEDDDNPDDDKPNPDDDKPNPEDELPIPTEEDDDSAPVVSGDDNFDVYVNGDKAFTGTRKECDEYILNSCTDDDNVDVMPVRTESRRVKTKKGKIVEKKSSRISIFEYLVRR